MRERVGERAGKFLKFPRTHNPQTPSSSSPNQTMITLESEKKLKRKAKKRSEGSERSKPSTNGGIKREEQSGSKIFDDFLMFILDFRRAQQKKKLKKPPLAEITN